jgi:hypothetical protein
MTLARLAPGNRVARFGTKLYLLWAGLSIGVALLATPAKFLAPSLTLPVALDVGQHTFRVYNDVELALLGIVLAVGIWSTERKRWYAAALLLGSLVLTQALWLIPALDLRVIAIQAGRSPPSSYLHAVYIAAEVVKVFWLLVLGMGYPFSRSGGTCPPRLPRPRIFRTLQARWRS